MLTKLLEKDLQAAARTFLPMILGSMVVSILAKILLEVGTMSVPYNDSYISNTNEFMVASFVIFLVLCSIYIVALFIMTLVFIVSDFYKTTVGEQTYLTHTLPIKTNTLIASKLIIAIFRQLVVYLLAFLSFLLSLVGYMPQIPRPEMLTDFNMTLGMTMGEYASFMTTCVIIGILSSPLMFYASIAIGHLFGKHKIVGAILSYPDIYTAMQIICTMAMIVLGCSFISTLIRTDVVNINFHSSFLSSYMWFTIILLIVTSVTFYFITNFVMNEKLNLE